jgi:hypothetical protein
MSWAKQATIIPVLCALGVVLTANRPALGLNADLAKKCREMMIKAHPPQVAGSSTGSAQQERSYFQTCVARAGKMDSEPGPTEGRGK